MHIADAYDAIRYPLERSQTAIRRGGVDSNRRIL